GGAAPGAGGALPPDGGRSRVGRPPRRPHPPPPAALESLTNPNLEGRLACVSTYDAVKDLPLTIESYALEPLAREVARDFTLRRTVVVLRGAGEEGRGEDVDYDPYVQEQFQKRTAEVRGVGEHTVDWYSVRRPAVVDYRRG